MTTVGADDFQPFHFTQVCFTGFRCCAMLTVVLMQVGAPSWSIHILGVGAKQAYAIFTASCFTHVIERACPSRSPNTISTAHYSVSSSPFWINNFEKILHVAISFAGFVVMMSLS